MTEPHPHADIPPPATSPIASPQTPYWAAWLLAIVPLLLWWFFDQQAAIAKLALPGWYPWMPKGLFTAWAAIWSPGNMTLLAFASLRMLDQRGEVVPEPFRFFAIMVLYAIVEGAVAISAFGAGVDRLHEFDELHASGIIGLWFAAMVLSYVLIRTQPSSPPKPALSTTTS